jgi:opacity protein-like surface antigen
MSRRTVWLAMVVAVLALATPRPARAEWFIDFYGGVVFPQDADLDIDGFTVTNAFKFDTEATGGGRFGLWLNDLGLPWLGVALDASYFAPAAAGSGGAVRLEIVPISTLAMFRLPLAASRDFPDGRVQPYLAGGPGLFVTRVKVNVPGIGEQHSETRAELGADVRGGIAFMLTPAIGLFAEGRYTFFQTDSDGGRIELDIGTVHVVGGVTLRW